MNRWSAVLSQEVVAQLLANAREQALLGQSCQTRDFHPVVKLFSPWAADMWLLSEMREDGMAFGLFDHGYGTPDVGNVSMDEICALRGPRGLRVQCDPMWKAAKPLSHYANEAGLYGRIKA
jgi:hypothetical protein